jgi:glutamate dehydrogenase
VCRIVGGMTTRSAWLGELEQLLIAEHGQQRGGQLLERYRDAFPPSYGEAPASASADIECMERFYSDDSSGVASVTMVEDGGTVLRCRLSGAGEPLLLSDLVPIFAGFGLAVAEQQRVRLRPAGRPEAWVDRFDLLARKNLLGASVAGFDDALRAVIRGEAEADGFNALVLGAGLSWGQAAVLRAYAKYLRQGGSRFSQAYIENALRANADVVRLLVELFETRFDPARVDGQAGKLDAADAGLLDGIGAALEHVASLDQDRILRSFQALIEATLRTSYFQHISGRESKPYLTFKLAPRALPELPAPRPMFETWVYSPRFEGVHLRFGPIARGGLRWSDRREDFRTEILGLVKAQSVKNAVIVPAGAKGGFVCKQLPDSAGRDAFLAEGTACYQLFIGGLLDLTDNLVDGEVVPPRGVVRRDGDDPYLVVAADKGTATFSDLANEVAERRGFWLGDAFASGGRTGYDHKAMGITARGAWESVKRHLRELGLDSQAEDFTAVGIGDMSGDVFGNGMLASEHIRLVVAFDHRHIFLDPDPDARSSYRERRRLFGLAGSSWADYDPALISAGGGVYPRTAKSIPLTREVSERLGFDAGYSTVTPAELIRAVLTAPVDLLWNGGIGTYVKAAAERNVDVGDKANDAVRVDASQLRCRVVGEGGNLGFTQLGRVEYARAGGRINTDAIDNSAGVDTSDHEVNLKVLLDPMVRAGKLSVAARNDLLAQVAGEVADLVLANNYRQNLQLSVAEAHAADSLDRHVTLIRFLEREGYLDRVAEFLPDEVGVAALQSSAAGLSRPELCVLLAHSKRSLRDDLDDSDVPDDPHLLGELLNYFPTLIRDRFGADVAGHPLRREIIATSLVNDLVDHLGPGFVYRLEEGTGVGTADAVRAYVVVRDVFALPGIWSTLRQMPAPSSRAELLVLEHTARLLEQCAAWLARHRRMPLAMSSEVDSFRAAVEPLARALPGLLDAQSRLELDEHTSALVAAGVPRSVAAATALLGPLASAFDVVELSRDCSVDAVEAASVYFAVGDQFGLGRIRARIADTTVDSHWTSIAKARLLDEVATHQRQLAASMLAAAPRGAGEAAVSRWIGDHRQAMLRWDGVAAELRRSDAGRLAPALVAVQTLGDVAALPA